MTPILLDGNPVAVVADVSCHQRIRHILYGSAHEAHFGHCPRIVLRIEAGAGQLPQRGAAAVLAHAGGGIVSAEAQVAASICNNLYLETSWCLGEDIRWMISTVGPDRVMMGAEFRVMFL